MNEENVALPKEEEEKNIEIIGISFREAGKIYYFDPMGTVIEPGKRVIVETARGIEIGTVKVKNKLVPASEIVTPLKPITRPATEEDLKKDAENREAEMEAAIICKKKIAAHKLEMSLVAVEYTFDRAKLIFYSDRDAAIALAEDFNLKRLLSVYDVMTRALEDNSRNVSVLSIITVIGAKIKFL